ncbi:ATP-binding protein [Promicromonospora iranensis]|uniref:histidine kinase n=1 Tax=Promicromonospora iranensis TaxID=1105144 RepID=A0ABU2CQA4_9MICO|nr:ATP-binding protein [Promicromonospora iranensis]MDR7383499.1 HAMP domain-containing protein/anti-sigma regulatory factor (Ser/Thr protein kinase) [Promicromonospora iranensis]
MFRRLGVRGKVLATLVTPAIVLVIAAAYIIGLSVVDAMRAQQTSDLVAALKYQDVAGTTFAQERAYNIVAMVDDGPSGDQARVALLQGMPEMEEDGVTQATNEDGTPKWAAPAAQAQTIKALDERDEALLDIDISMLDQRVKNAVAQTIEDRAAITDVQEQVAAGRLTEQRATRAYGGYIDGALEVMDAIADTSEDRELGTRLEAYHSMDQLMLTNTYERPVVSLALGIFTQHEQGEAASRTMALRAADLVNLGDRQWNETQDLYDRIPGDYQAPVMDGVYGTVRGYVARGDLASIQPAQIEAFANESTKWVEEGRIVRDAVREDAAAFAQEQADVAANRAYLTGGIAIAALGFSIITALVIARRLVSPLRRLTQAAGVVRDRLPTLVEQVSVPGQGPSIDLDPISVESSDEIGQLAAAFNDVNRTTIDVAREQAALRGSIAEMFVNVARRDQVLLNRQLAFLDDLERSEEDPSTLSNLFRLDHLATRMRRNAESLLVLAGIDSGRRVRQPMPVSDVIRTASSEIELYDRVRLNLVVDPMMLGHNALNAAHLLAELLENATMFSEPHTPVEVTTARDEQFVTVVVRDHGLGMNPDEVAEANRKVLSHAASDAVGAQRLGLYVVGRLSDRLGAQVEFGVGEGGTGTEVTVRFPAVLFMPDNAMPLPMPTDPLEANTQAAASQFNGGLATGPGTGAMRGAGAPTNGFGSPAITAASPATTSVPQQGGMPVPTGTSQIAAAAFAAQPAPVAQKVDINALTDGTTALGLARRRSSTAAQPMAETTPTGSIVLPEIQTPSLPQEYQGDDNAWAPPSNVSEGSSLPSRQRAPQPEEPVAPVFEDTTPAAVDVDQRSALFSSFRSLSTIDPVDGGGTQSLQLDPVTQDPAALPGMSDTDVMRFPAGGGAQTPPAQAPARAFGGPYQGDDEPSRGYGDPYQGDDEQSQGFGADAPQGPDSSFEALPAFEELMADLPSRRSTGSGTQQGAKPAQQKRGLFGRRPGQPATGELRAYQPQERPASRPIQTVSGPAGGVPFGAPNVETQSFQAPNFSAPSGPPQDFPAPRVPQDFPAPRVPQDFQAPKAPQSSPAPQPAGPMTGTFPSAAPEQEQRPAADPTYQRGFQEGYQRAVQESLTSAVPAVPSAPAGGTVPVPTQAQTAAQAPAQGNNPFVDAAPRAAAASAPASAPEQAPTSFASAPATQAVPMATAQQSFEAPAREFSEPYPTGAVYDPTYGSPAPLAKRAAGTDGDGKDPLDPEYVRDSVEARSEWTASAVLYEEMTSLLRRGAFQEDDAKENDSYRPAAVNTEVVGGGLTRRTRGASGTGADPTVERLSARIDRDPEQLRSRLSAFQSATARGRSESVDEGGSENENGRKADGDSTWAPSTVNHVPDSAPQSR